MWPTTGASIVFLNVLIKIHNRALLTIGSLSSGGAKAVLCICILLRRASVAGTLVSVLLPASAQTVGGSAPASSSSVPIESEAIAYEAVGELARHITDVVSRPVVTKQEFGSMRGLSRNKHAQELLNSSASTVGADKKTTFASVFLLGTANNLSAIGAFEAFMEANKELAELYKREVPSHKEEWSDL